MPHKLAMALQKPTKPGSKAAASLVKQQQQNHNQKGLPYEP